MNMQNIANIKLNILVILASILTLLFVLTLTPAAYAGCPGTTPEQQVLCGAGNPTGGEATINQTIQNVIRVVSAIVGIAAVFVMIVAGIMFVTSAGDSNRAARARSAIIFAAAGLLVAALAQAIVRFVLDQTP